MKSFLKPITNNVNPKIVSQTVNENCGPKIMIMNMNTDLQQVPILETNNNSCNMFNNCDNCSLYK